MPLWHPDIKDGDNRKSGLLLHDRDSSILLLIWAVIPGTSLSISSPTLIRALCLNSSELGWDTRRISMGVINPLSAVNKYALIFFFHLLYFLPRNLSAYCANSRSDISNGFLAGSLV